MDFTSDSALSVTSNSSLGAGHLTEGQLSSEDKINESFLNVEDSKKLQLVDLKAELLAKRNDLLQEIDSYKDQISAAEKAPATRKNMLDENANNLLLDLLVASTMDRDEGNYKHDINTENPIKHIDGRSAVQQELLSKYDTLPLINLDLRLRYLREYLYSNIELQVLSSELESIDVTSTTLKVDFINSKLTIQLKLSYDRILATLVDFQVLSVSNNYKLKLKPLLVSCENNPNLLLFCCNELDRLVAKRLFMLRDVQDTYKSQLKISRLFNSDESLLLVSRVPQDDRTLRIIRLRIDFNIYFNRDSKFPLPSSQISAKLWKDDRLILNEDNSILKGLINEYGVLSGLKEFSRSCLFPNVYSK